MRYCATCFESACAHPYLDFTYCNGRQTGRKFGVTLSYRLSICYKVRCRPAYSSDERVRATLSDTYASDYWPGPTHLVDSSRHTAANNRYTEACVSMLAKPKREKTNRSAQSVACPSCSVFSIVKLTHSISSTFMGSSAVHVNCCYAAHVQALLGLHGCAAAASAAFHS